MFVLSFTSYSIDQFENIVQDYLEALLKELDFCGKDLCAQRTSDDVYWRWNTNIFKRKKIWNICYMRLIRDSHFKDPGDHCGSRTARQLEFREIKDSKEIWCDKDQYQSTVNE